MKIKSLRLAAAAFVALVSLTAVTQAGAAPGVTMADRQWCC